MAGLQMKYHGTKICRYAIGGDIIDKNETSGSGVIQWNDYILPL